MPSPPALNPVGRRGGPTSCPSSGNISGMPTAAEAIILRMAALAGVLVSRYAWNADDNVREEAEATIPGA